MIISYRRSTAASIDAHRSSEEYDERRESGPAHAPIYSNCASYYGEKTNAQLHQPGYGRNLP